MDMRLIWLALGTFAIGVEGFVIASLLPGIAADTAVTITQSGYLVLAYALAYAVGAPVLAALTGTMDRRVVLAAASLVFAAGGVVAAVSTGYVSLLIARALMAFCAGLYAATAQATAVQMASVDHRARAVSIVVAGTTFAVAFGAPLGALVAGFAGWRGTYFAIALVGLVAAVAIWFMLPRGLRGESKTLRERLAVVAMPGVLPALLTTLLYMTGPFAAYVYLAPITTRAMGMGIELLPAVMLAFGVGAAIGNYVGGQLADRIGARRTVVLATVAQIAFLVGLSFIPQLPSGIIAPVYFAFMLVWGITGWMYPPAQVSRLVAMVPTSAPLVLSLNASALYLGTASGALVGGLVLDHASVFDIGWVGALFGLAALGVLVASERQRRSVFARQG